MKKDSVTDYLSSLLFRLFSPILRNLPAEASLFLGRKLGELFYYFDARHRALAYSNIKKAFGAKLSPFEINKITLDFYRNFGQNFIEIFLIPLIDKKYFNKYITIEGKNYISEAFKKNKGIIFLSVHEGSWELSSIISLNLRLPFNLFIRQQKFPNLNKLLNSYRRQKGCRIIERENQARRLIEIIKANQAVGMTADQGGRTGVHVRFFGKDTPMSSGAIRVALKYGTVILPVFSTRINGPHIKVTVGPALEVKKTGNLGKDIHDNLQEITNIFERYISEYPQEYLWTYKIWKYSKEKKILILSDGKPGHLRQAQLAAKITGNYFKDKGINTKTEIIEIKLKNRFSKYGLNLCSCFLGNYRYQQYLWCLRRFLDNATYNLLININSDVVISCGSSLGPVNYILCAESLAKSIVVMRPGILGTSKFDLVIMPKHDRPPKRKNIVVTDGALNLIDAECLREDSKRLIQYPGFYIGLLIGGDTKGFHLKASIISEVIKQLKQVSEKLNMDILVTTSRRTPKDIENLLKEEFKDYPRCKLLVIANEKNIPEAVGGILGLSSIIITSPESISMISEAASSKKYVVVFDVLPLGKKHQRFLRYFSENKYIYLAKSSALGRAIEDIWQKTPQVNSLNDNLLVKEALKRVL